MRNIYKRNFYLQKYSDLQYMLYIEIINLRFIWIYSAYILISFWCRVALLVVIEISWNTYPSTVASSLLLHCAHAIAMAALLLARKPHPQSTTPPHTSASKREWQIKHNNNYNIKQRLQRIPMDIHTLYICLYNRVSIQKLNKLFVHFQ